MQVVLVQQRDGRNANTSKRQLVHPLWLKQMIMIVLLLLLTSMVGYKNYLPLQQETKQRLKSWTETEQQRLRATPPHRVPCTSYESLPHGYMLSHSSFLPSPLQNTTNTTSCDINSSSVSTAMRARLQHQLFQQQYDSVCPPDQQFLLSHTVGYGFGSYLNMMIQPFMMAHHSGWAFWSPSLGKFAPSETAAAAADSKKRIPDSGSQAQAQFVKDQSVNCTVGDFSCFFEPLSYCEQKQPTTWRHTAKGRTSGRSYCDENPSQSLCRYSLSVQDQSIGNHSNSTYGEQFPEYIEDPEYRQMGHFWYVNQWIDFLLNPNLHLRETIQRVKHQIGLISDDGTTTTPYLSLHIRRGDACFNPSGKARRCDTLEYYLNPVVQEVAQRYGIRSIYLATDDPDMITEALTNYTPQFQWFFYNYTYPTTEAAEAAVAPAVMNWDKNQQPSLENFYSAQKILIDLFLLAEGSVFVGKFTSNVDRLAYSLMANRVGGYAPFVSLDESPWCFDYTR